MRIRTGSAKITILVDNQAALGLCCEHGFSSWIETADRRLLFDTGQGAAPASPSGIRRCGFSPWQPIGIDSE